jgi:toxin ParE1/3/4
MTVRLTAAARGDLEGIKGFTIEHWGQAQWLAYFGDTLSSFERIAAFPESGRARVAFVPGLRSVRRREHVIFYLIAGDGVVMLQRILHGARNAQALDWSERRK